MIRSLAPLVAVFAAAFFFHISFGAMASIVALRGHLEGFSTGALGLISAGFYFGFFIGGQFTLRLLRRTSYIRAYATCGSLCGVLILVFQLTVRAEVWAALSLVFGAFFALACIVSEAWLNAVVTRETRSRAYGFYMIVAYVGLAAGQGALTQAGDSPQIAFSLAAAAAMLAIVPVCMTRFPEPQLTAETRALSFADAYKIAPLACIGVLSAGLVSGCDSLLVVYGAAVGLEASRIAILLAALKLSGMILQVPIGWLSDFSRDRRTVIFAVSLGGAGLAAGLFFGALYHWYILLALVFVFGGVNKTVYPLCVSYGGDFVSRENFSPFCGKLFQLYSIGAFVGPSIAGAVMGATAPSALFVFIAAVCLLMAGGIAARKLMPAVAPLRVKPFVAAPAPGAVASPRMDPRGGAPYLAKEIGPTPPSDAEHPEAAIGPQPPSGAEHPEAAIGPPPPQKAGDGG